MSEHPRRVLIYRLGSLGDMVVALPVMHLVERAFPGAERRMLTNFPVNVKAPAASEIFGGSGLVQGYLRYRVGTRNPLELAKLWWAIARWRPQVLVYLAAGRGVAAARRDAAFFRLCGVRRFVGVPLTEEAQEPQARPEGGGYEYECELLARNLRELGDARLEARESWDLRLSEAEHHKARAALGGLAGTPFFLVSVGTKVQAKDWGVERWRELLRRLPAVYPGYGLALAGAASESEMSEQAAAGWREVGGGPVVNLCGKLTPRESAAAMAEARLFIGNDSGPMHLAAAVGTRCVAIFAARALPLRWFPYGAGHRVLYHKVECWLCRLETCLVEKKRCLTSITVEEVQGEIAAAMDEQSPPQTWFHILKPERSADKG